MAADITDDRALGGNLRLQLSSLFQTQGETSPGKNLGLRCTSRSPGPTHERTSTSKSMPSWAHKTKAPRKPGRSQISTALRASGSDLGRFDLQKLAGARDWDRPRLHRLRNLAHEVDV